jgi:acylphosphatase
MKTRIHAIFRGRVQGVFFRDYTCRKSLENGVTGWVKNLDNGDVEAVFEGEEERIASVIGWLRNEHPHARVDGIERSTGKYTGEFENFEVVY